MILMVQVILQNNVCLSSKRNSYTSTDFISDTAFVKGDMSLELLSIVRRTNKQIISLKVQAL